MTNNRTLKWIVAISIALMFNLLIHLVTNLVHPYPTWDDFCGQAGNHPPIQTQSACEAIGGRWTPGTERDPKPVTGWCDDTYTCREEYEAASDTYAKQAFVVWIILGALALGAGLMLSSVNSAVSLGASLGGLLAFIITTVRFWEDLGGYVRLLLVVIALGLLVWVSIKKLQDK